MLPSIYPDYPLLPKEVSVTKNMTADTVLSLCPDRSLVCCNDRNVLDAFLESWMETHLGETPVVYFHHANHTLAAFFRQLLPQSLGLGGSALAEYDPIHEIPLPLFFNALASRSQTLRGRISVSYLKGIASLLLYDHYEPTLYRLNSYASKHLGRIMEERAEDMDDDTFALLNRYMQKNDSIVQDTLDCLDMLCDCCSMQLNRGAMRQGKSIYSALKEGRGVSIDVSELSNSLAGDMIFAQLSLTQRQGTQFQVVLDLDTIPNTLLDYLSEIGVSQIKLLACPNVWTVAQKGGNTFAEDILSSRNQTVFVPNGNMQLCRNLSSYLDTYWRQNKTYTEGTQRGRNRKALSILPMFANGRNTNISVSYMRESVLSANELRGLPSSSAILIAENTPSILACKLVAY